MNLGKILKYLFWGTIILLFTGGFLWNCTFSMDTTKYPDRTTCAISQYQVATTYIITKYTDYLTARMEGRVERRREALSGVLNNFHSGITK